MGNAITSPPNKNYDFGYDFSYALWTEGTVVTLCNVPWNNDYRDIVKFADRAALNTYINGLSGPNVNVNNVSYIKPNTPIRLDIPFNAAYKYNYLRANNPLQPVSGDVDKDFYYFITDVRYIAPNTTELVLQLDVWQTFGFDVNFGQCYIDRGHVGIANSKQFDNYGRDYLTVPEAIDTGGEYLAVTHKNVNLMSYSVQPNSGSLTGIQFLNGWDILVCSTTDLTANPGTVAAPNLVTAKGGQAFGLPSGADYWIFGRPSSDLNASAASSLSLFMYNKQGFPWMTQGIISITVIPHLEDFMSFTYGAEGTPVKAPQSVPTPKLVQMFPGWRDDYLVVHHLPDRYLMLKKFFTFPYMAIELTTFTGTPIVIKPESWANNDALVLIRMALIPPNQRLAISPYKYNSLVDSPTDPRVPGSGQTPSMQPGGDDSGDWLEFATQINSFPALAIVNNGGLSYLAANAHGIAFQRQSGGWQQQRALNTNDVTYDQKSAGMNLANQLTGIGIKADTAQTGITNLVGTSKAYAQQLTNAGSALTSADPLAGMLGAGIQGVANGIDNAITVGGNDASLAVRNAAARASTRDTVANQGYLRDTNKNLADYSARGDYQNTIAGINAKVQDANLIQPTTSGQVGGESMNITNNNAVVSMRIKMLDYANMRLVGEYWLRYGYSVRQFFTPPSSLQVMSHFTYWKMVETYINTGPLPESMKQIIRGIFEKGVTVWSNPNNIGNIDFAINQPLSGITLP